MIFDIYGNGFITLDRMVLGAETETSIWLNLRHWLRRKLPICQFPVQSVMNI